MGHIVYVKAKDTKRFNYASFAAYKNRQGKTVYLIDPDGNKMDKWELHQSMQALDIDNEFDNRIYEYLQGHPLMDKGKFVLQDTRAEETEKADKILISAEAVSIANKLTPRESDDLCRLIGISNNFDSEIKKARLLRFAASSPAKFTELFNNKDKDYLVFLKKAHEAGLIKLVNGVWKHGAQTMGIHDEGAVKWLKDNKDVYALMRQDLRGTTKAAPVKVEKPVIEEPNTIDEE